jgi:hypothetical protein
MKVVIHANVTTSDEKAENKIPGNDIVIANDHDQKLLNHI